MNSNDKLQYNMMIKITTILNKLLIKLLDKNKGVYSFFKAGTKLVPKSFKLNETEEKDLYQGFLNFQSIKLTDHYFWPKWIMAQLTPTHPLYTPPINQHIINHTYKNWTSLSRKNSKINTQISPNGVCTPIQNEWSLDTWVEIDKCIFVQSQAETEQVLNQKIGMIETEWKLNRLHVKTEQFIDAKLPICHQQTTFKNHTESPVKFNVYFCIQPIHTEGVSAIQNMTYLSNNSLVINKRLGLTCDHIPANVLLLNKRESNNIKQLKKWEKIYHADCPYSQGSGYLIYHFNLNPMESTQVSFKLNTEKKDLIPLLQSSLSKEEKKKLKTNISTLHNFSFEKKYQELKEHYTQHQANLDWILPNQKLTTQLKQSHFHLDTALQTLGVTSYSSEKTFSKLQQLCITIAYNRLGLFNHAQKLCLGLKHQHHRHQFLENCYWIIASKDYIKYAKDDVYRINYSVSIEKVMKKIIKSSIQHIIKPNLETSLRRSQLIPTNLNELSLVVWSFMAITMGQKILSKSNQPIETTAFKEFIRKAKHYISSELEILSEKYPKEGHQLDLIPQLLLWTPIINEEEDLTLISKLIEQIIKNTTQTGLIYTNTNGQGISITQNIHLLSNLIKINHPSWLTLHENISEYEIGTGSWPEKGNGKSKGGCGGDGHDRLANALLIICGHQLLINETQDAIELCPSIPNEWWSETEQTIGAQQVHSSEGLISFTCNFTNSLANLSIQRSNISKKIILDFKKPIQSLTFDEVEHPISGTVITLTKTVKNIQVNFS